jgi:tetratricopeptide (TPR) repeat protein
MTDSTRPLKLFYCYAHEDKDFRDQLDIHLASLKRQQVLTTWYDGEIKAGFEWEQEINRHLSKAHIIVLFVSAYFLHSDYCYTVEMKRALERHEAGNARVVPIIVRPVDWQHAPFSKLQALPPPEARPVSLWLNRDEAWLEVVKKIEAIALDLRETEQGHSPDNVALADLKQTLATFEHAIQLDPTDIDAHIYKGIVFTELEQYEEALTAFEQAIQLDPTYALAHTNKGAVLTELKRYEEALTALELAIQLDSTYVPAHANKGALLFELKRYEKALATYEHIIQLDPTDVYAHTYKGTTLLELKQHEDALAAFEYAIQLDPTCVLAYANKGATLIELKQYEEALVALEHAIQLDSTYTLAHTNKGAALVELKRYEEALAAYERAIQLDPDDILARIGRSNILIYLGRSNTQLRKQRQRGIPHRLKRHLEASQPVASEETVGTETKTEIGNGIGPTKMDSVEDKDKTGTDDDKD